MKSYKDQRGVYHRTQAEAKASGVPFEMVDIPTSHAELIEFINQIRQEQPVALSGDEGAADSHLTPTPQVADDGDGPAPPYENGHPTVPFMGSRDPRAVFTCTNCGKDNSNG